MALALVTGQTEIGINNEALQEWIDYRAQDLKKPMTPRAIKMVTKKLLQWSEPEQMRMVENAIEQNWRGIYWVEPPKQQSTRQSNIYDELTDHSWAH